MDIDLIKSLDNDILELEDFRLELWAGQAVSHRKFFIFFTALGSIIFLGIFIYIFSITNTQSIQVARSILVFFTFFFILGNISFYASFNIRKRKLTQQFQARYKKSFVKKVLADLEPRYKFDHSSGIRGNDFKASDFFNFHRLKYESEDLIKGKLEDTLIRFSEIRCSATMNEEDNNLTEIFDGLFFVVNLKHNFNEIFIFNKGLRRRIKTKGIKLEPKGKLINWNKYSIYSTDPDAVNFYLSPALLTFLNQLDKEGKGLPLLKVKENKIYFGFQQAKDFYAPPINQSLIVREQAKGQNNEILDHGLELTNTLNNHIQSLIDELKFGIRVAQELYAYAQFLNEIKDLDAL